MVGVGNIVSVGGSGGGSSGGSGIQELNSQTGPIVTLVGTSGIVIAPVASNQINIGLDQSSLSGLSATKFSAEFTSITSGTFDHNFNTLDVITQVFDENRCVIWPDKIIVENGDQVSIRFNVPQTGRVVIV